MYRMIKVTPVTLIIATLSSFVPSRVEAAKATEDVADDIADIYKNIYDADTDTFDKEYSCDYFIRTGPSCLKDLDLDENGRASRREIAKLEFKVFFDLNGDGTMTYDDANIAAEAMGYGPGSLDFRVD